MLLAPVWRAHTVGRARKRWIFWVRLFAANGRKVRGDVWGIGLMLGFDEQSGVILNATTLFSRCLPAVSFGENGETVEAIRAVGGANAKQIAERFVVLKLEECALLNGVNATHSMIQPAQHESPFLKVLMAQGLASSFT